MGVWAFQDWVEPKRSSDHWSEIDCAIACKHTLAVRWPGLAPGWRCEQNGRRPCARPLAASSCAPDLLFGMHAQTRTLLMDTVHPQRTGAIELPGSRRDRKLSDEPKSARAFCACILSSRDGKGVAHHDGAVSAFAADLSAELEKHGRITVNVHHIRITEGSLPEA